MNVNFLKSGVPFCLVAVYKLRVCDVCDRDIKPTESSASRRVALHRSYATPWAREFTCEGLEVKILPATLCLCYAAFCSVP